MSVTVASLFTTVSYDLLEDTGLAIGIVTQQEFLDMLGLVIMDFLRRTRLIWKVYTQQIISGTSVYPVPELNPEVIQVYVNAQLVGQTDLFFPANLTYSVDTGATIQQWHEDQLGIQKFELLPIPNFTGTAGGFPAYGTFGVGARNVTIVVSSLASKETWGAGDTLDTIPDTFTPYLVYGVLEKIFSMDGESKDEQRALYCRSRYEEGITLAKAVFIDLMEGPEQ